MAPGLVRVTFICGHDTELGSDVAMSAVQCSTCGQRRVRAVSGPPPRIRAVDCEATGPYVTKDN